MYTFFSRLLEARIRPSGALFITDGSFKQVILLLMKRSSKETVELGYCQSHILKIIGAVYKQTIQCFKFSILIIFFAKLV